MERRTKTTLKDVAKVAGVSFALVSKYVTRNPEARISKATQARIAAAVKQLHYCPSASARTLRKGRSKAVGLLSGDLTNFYCAHVADLAIREIRERGYQLLIVLNQQGREDEMMRSLLERDVDGIIFFGFKPPMEMVSCPLIVNNWHVEGCSEVIIDLKHSMDEAMKTAKGRVAGLFYENSIWKAEFEAAAERQGVKAETNLLHLDYPARREGIRAVCKTRPDCIITSGWQTLVMLQKIIDDEMPDYSPKLYLHANCTGPFLADKRIAGVIYSSTTELTRKICAALVEQIETPDAELAALTIPSWYIPSGTREYAALVTEDYKLT